MMVDGEKKLCLSIAILNPSQSINFRFCDDVRRQIGNRCLDALLCGTTNSSTRPDGDGKWLVTRP